MRQENPRTHNCRVHEPRVSTGRHDDGRTTTRSADLTQDTRPRDTSRPVESPRAITHAHPDDEGVEILSQSDHEEIIVAGEDAVILESTRGDD
ncbi:hypothetical protein [Natronorubrum thiooxidans]|uniref:hypothetical protein n=1 Tax=Natronorubrum thiooxidans TaxID=308853 RepID=UPI00117EAD05|nr:hypothetical protein [Natronorubrum thiooxidans]